MKSETTSVIRKIAAVEKDALEFDELVKAWNKLCEKAGNDDKTSTSFEDIANVALITLSSNAKYASYNNVDKKMGRMLDAFPHATYMVSTDGLVTAYNAAAFEKYDLLYGDGIDTLPFVLPKAETITSLIKNVFFPDSNREANSQQSILKQIYNNAGKHEGTIAVSPATGSNQSALVFIIGVKWQTESLGLIQDQFELTDAEVAILRLFVDGNSLQEIAKKRSRSYTTIRTQFQSLLNKTDSSSQTELLRTVLSISEFVTDVNLIADALNHPHRRKAELFIEGGRVIEVTFMGDFNGQAVVCCTDALTYTFTAEFEQALFDNNLYFISICLPGFGNTDPVPAEENRLERIAQDIESVLSQLNIDQCPIAACSTASPIAASMPNLLSDKISHLFLISCCYPFPYWSPHGTQSPWADAVLKACSKNTTIKKYILRNGVKAWPAMGASRFLKLQVRSNTTDGKYVHLPEAIREYDKSLKTATKHGSVSYYEDLKLVFTDWTEEIEKSKVPVTIIHGTDNAVYPPEGVRTLARDYPEKIDLVEIANAGFSVPISHPALLAGILRQKVNQQGSAVFNSNSCIT